ncbi:MAG: T9SS type A sorting domain-containing protein [Bacteroidia bacterium]
MRVIDTVNNCDTTYCKTITTNCFKSSCIWKDKKPDFKVIDSCLGNNAVFIGYVLFRGNTNSTYTYQWTVNNVPDTKYKGNSLYSYITKNGTYTVCVRVKDTANNCDTTFCETFKITCLQACDWKSQKPKFEFSDSCFKSSAKIFAHLTFNGKYNTKYAYKWSINQNQTNSTSPYVVETFSKNGYYTFCVNVYDSVNNCDTNFCETIQIKCLSGCDWKSMKPNFYLTDSCNAKSLHSGIFFNGKSRTDLQYTWRLNGKVFNYNDNIVSQTISSNGGYTVCVTVYDSSKNCDTTFCESIKINCFKACNWKDRKPDLSVIDTCGRNINALSGIIYFNGKYRSDYIYKWTVNNTTLNYTGPSMYHNLNKNGTYFVCVNIKDTANNCDTTICKTVQVNCITSCNWKDRKAKLEVWDTCRNTCKEVFNRIDGWITFNNKVNTSYKYTWRINGTIVQKDWAFLLNPVSQNGKYTVCLTVHDTINNCDTSFCETVYMNCIQKCNWSRNMPKLYLKDSCSKNFTKIIGEVDFKECRKSSYLYKWTVNGTRLNYTGPAMLYDLKKNGTYTVCINVYDSVNRCDTTICDTLQVKCPTLGIGKSFQAIKTIIVYPNPTQGEIKFEWNGGAAKYQLSNQLGQILMEGEVNETVNVLNLKGYKPGVYGLRIIENNQVYVKSILLLE